MARETRAQRRAARAQQASAQPERRAPRANGPERAPERAPAPHEHKQRFSFVRESWAELQKVEWPGQQQVIQATIAVLIACIVVGIYLWANDQLWQPVVKRLVGQ
jgi:preprotein translocase SecE subunit